MNTHDGLSEIWSDFMGSFEERAAVSGRHIERITREIGAKKIIDLAAGAAYDARYLIEQGHSVDINEIDPAFMREAEITLQGLPHRSYSVDWRDLSSKVDEKYDLGILVGNSLTYLHREEERLAALSEMFKILKPEGYLLVDHRNYEKMLSDPDQEGRPLINREMYVGTGVRVVPVMLTQENVRFTYLPDWVQDCLDLYPLGFDETRTHLEAVGFTDIRSFASWQEQQGIDPLQHDENTFFQHLATKAR